MAISDLEDIRGDEWVYEETQEDTQNRPQAELFVHSESPALYIAPSTSKANQMPPTIVSFLTDGVEYLVTR